MASILLGVVAQFFLALLHHNVHQEHSVTVVAFTALPSWKKKRRNIKSNNRPIMGFTNRALYHQMFCVVEKQPQEGAIHSSRFQLDATMGPPVDLQYMCLKAGSTNSSQEDEEDKYPPVIMLHGLLGQKRNLASLGAALYSQLQKKRDIYALDLRNHGDNTHDWRDEMSYSHMAQDVIYFMDQHAIKDAVMIGHSMGGKLASSLALSHPERIQGLIVLDIAPVRYTDKDKAWKSVQDIVDTLDKVNIAKFDKKSELDSHLQHSVEDPSLRAFILTSIHSVQSSVGGSAAAAAASGSRATPRVPLQWKINMDAIVQQMNVLAGFDVCNHGSSETSLQHLQYHGDAFFVNSPISRYIKHSHMDTIKRYFPNFMLTTIKGVGHSLHTDSPEATVELLKKYLDR